MEATVEKNPLISIYQSLDKADGRRLGKWLDSPIHNQRDDVRELHAYLLGGNDRLYKTSSLAKMRIWKRIFPEESFDDARLRQTFHWALKATEAFLAYEYWQRETFKRQLALSTELRQRNVANVAGRNLKKTIRLQDQIPLRNEEFFRNEYLLELEKEEYRNAYTPLESPRLKEMSESLDITYFIEKLKVSGNAIYQRRIRKVEYKLRLVDKVVEEVSKLDLTRYPVLAIHYYGYKGLIEDDASGEIIGRLRDAVEKHGDLLTSTDLRHVILMAINLCISNVNKGREVFIRECFEWYKLGLMNEVLAENNRLTRETYINVVSNALKLNEHDWIKKFIDENSKKLEDAFRENTERFARARLSYKLKEYKGAMGLLVLVDFKHPVYNLLAKTLLLKIYYELDEYDAMESQLDSMTTYIRRKEIAELRRDNFNNIVRFVRQLSRVPNGDRSKLAELRGRIEKASPLTEKKWLLEQLDAR